MKKICIVGLGLIGGSLALAVKSRKLAECVFGVAKRKETLDYALKNNVIDKGSLEFKEGIKDAELIILAAPVVSIIEYLDLLKKAELKEVIITDVGSTKEQIVKMADSYELNFVGSHPMTGSEKTGIEHADKDLFDKRVCIITKSDKTKDKNIKYIKKFWEELSSKITIMLPKEHDIIISDVSHLPHIIASNLVASINKEDLSFAGNGFWDTTRLASGSPVLWKDICSTNKENIVKSIEKFQKNLDDFKKMMVNEEFDRVESFLEEAKGKRG